MTTCLSDPCDEAIQRADVREREVATVDLHWRRLGGDAHALGWQLLFGNLTWSSCDPNELSPVAVTGDVAHVVESGSWAFHFLKKAIEQHKLLSAGNS